MPDLGKSGMVRMAFSISAAVGGEWIMIRLRIYRLTLKRTRYLAGSRGNRQRQIEAFQHGSVSEPNSAMRTEGPKRPNHFTVSPSPSSRSFCEAFSEQCFGFGGRVPGSRQTSGRLLRVSFEVRHRGRNGRARW